MAQSDCAGSPDDRALSKQIVSYLAQGGHSRGSPVASELETLTGRGAHYPPYPTSALSAHPNSATSFLQVAPKFWSSASSRRQVRVPKTQPSLHKTRPCRTSPGLHSVPLLHTGVKGCLEHGKC